ncbi:hypothetical protein AB4Z38_23390 [Arthrobacter sp. 2RAF6]|uniref:hypothetical protein n=1 Tax=Arthrobacter sp. 2RAF6 TaxID=3233002 RepID=UPI003F8ECC30
MAVSGPPGGVIDEHLGPQVGMLLAGAAPGVVTLLIGSRFAAQMWQPQVGPMTITWPSAVRTAFKRTNTASVAPAKTCTSEPDPAPEDWAISSRSSG